MARQNVDMLMANGEPLKEYFFKSVIAFKISHRPTLILDQK